MYLELPSFDMHTLMKPCIWIVSSHSADTTCLETKSAPLWMTLVCTKLTTFNAMQWHITSEILVLQQHMTQSWVPVGHSRCQRHEEPTELCKAAMQNHSQKICCCCSRFSNTEGPPQEPCLRMFLLNHPFSFCKWPALRL